MLVLSLDLWSPIWISRLYNFTPLIIGNVPHSYMYELSIFAANQGRNCKVTFPLSSPFTAGWTAAFVKVCFSRGLPKPNEIFDCWHNAGFHPANCATDLTDSSLTYRTEAPPSHTTRWERLATIAVISYTDILWECLTSVINRERREQPTPRSLHTSHVEMVGRPIHSAAMTTD